ncbi:hypothetical protein BXZ70DRAFT_358058 [Cristinia sonorae]|uniref:Uncharacterized protein n=1 Tax=Cristinia sonorae TaxID=1940300 RepID=A0A8K0UKF7_9AGAR|nr:hypothetical protein BXZ70DRAFT_358058 [Cristinia sonorae]
MIGLYRGPVTSSRDHMPLDWDVLMAALPFTIDHNANLNYGWDVKRRDLLNLMKTCHTLYRAGIPYLIKQISFKGDFTLATSLCDFILQDPHRADNVELVYLASFNQEPHVEDDQDHAIQMDKFITVLRLLRNVKTLHIDGPNALKLRSRGQELIDALAALPAIREIDFRRMDEVDEKLVRSLQAPIVSASLHWYEGWPDVPGTGTILAPHCAHLTSIELTHVPAFKPAVTFPLVHTFLHENIYYPFERAGELVDMFPSLKRLSLLASDEHSDLDDDEEREELREENQRLLAESRHRWKNLDYFETTAWNAYVLGFSCTVTSFKLYQWLETEEEIIPFQIVLKDLRPSYLNFACDLDHFPAAELGGLLPNAISQLTHLRIGFYWEDTKDLLDCRELLEEHLIKCLAGAPSLACLTIKIRYNKTPRPHITQPHEPLMPVSVDARAECRIATNRYLETLDTVKYVRRLSSHLPNLSFVSIQFKGGHQPTTYCSVTGKFESEGGDADVERLDEKLGRELLRRSWTGAKWRRE